MNFNLWVKMTNPSVGRAVVGRRGSSLEEFLNTAAPQNVGFVQQEVVAI